MYISLKKTIAQIDRYLAEGGGASVDQLHKMYDLTLRLQSQVLSVIYDMEVFGKSKERIANAYSIGKNKNSVVTLTIAETAQQRPLPYFDKAMVEIEIITSRGSDNARLWYTSNRAIQVVLNNLKGTFFEDDNMEHMAFSVVGRWGEKVLRLSVFWTLTDYSKSKASHECRVFGKTMRFRKCHGEQNKAKNIYWSWTPIGYGML